mgnify:FL=1
MPAQARSTVVFTGCLMKLRRLWGMRLLRNWIDRPLVNQEQIEERQNIVQVFLDNFFERSDLTDSLKGVL